MKNLLIVSIFLVFISGCKSTGSTTNSVAPLGSIGTVAPALANDMVKNVAAFIDREFACKEWDVVSVEALSADEELIFTKEGQIHTGKIAENWSLVQCGTPIKIGLAVMSDGNNGSYIAITRL